MFVVERDKKKFKSKGDLFINSCSSKQRAFIKEMWFTIWSKHLKLTGLKTFILMISIFYELFIYTSNKVLGNRYEYDIDVML